MSEKLTFTAIIKKGDEFKHFVFGGFCLESKKTLAQSLIDEHNPDKALGASLYATCRTLVDIAKKFGWLVSSNVLRVVADKTTASAFDNYRKASALLAVANREMTYLKRESEFTHSLVSIGGRREEYDARLTALAEAIKAQSSLVAEAREAAKNCREKLTACEYCVYSAINAEKEKAKTKEENNNK